MISTRCSRKLKARTRARRRGRPLMGARSVQHLGRPQLVSCLYSLGPDSAVYMLGSCRTTSSGFMSTGSRSRSRPHLRRSSSAARQLRMARRSKRARTASGRSRAWSTRQGLGPRAGNFDLRARSPRGDADADATSGLADRLGRRRACTADQRPISSRSLRCVRPLPHSSALPLSPAQQVRASLPACTA